MKAILEYNLPEDKEEFNDAIHGTKYKIVLDEIWEKCFRPARKNGYGNSLLDSDVGIEVIEQLIERYLHVISENEISIL